MTMETPDTHEPGREEAVAVRATRRMWLVAIACVAIGVLTGGSIAYVLLARADGENSSDTGTTTRAADGSDDEAPDEEPLQLVPVRMSPGLVSVAGWRADRERSVDSTLYLQRGDATMMVNAGTFTGTAPSSASEVEAVFAEPVWASQEQDRTAGARHWNDVVYSVVDVETHPVASLDFRMELGGVRYVGTYSLEMDDDVKRYVFTAVVQPGRRRSKAFDQLQFGATFEVTDRFLSSGFDASRLEPLEVDDDTNSSNRSL